MTKEGLLDIYGTFGWIAIGVGVAVLLLSPMVRRWMHLETLRDAPDEVGEGRDDVAGTARLGTKGA